MTRQWFAPLGVAGDIPPAPWWRWLGGGCMVVAAGIVAVVAVAMACAIGLACHGTVLDWFQ